MFSSWRYSIQEAGNPARNPKILYSFIQIRSKSKAQHKNKAPLSKKMAAINKDILVVYANANSLFDPTNGASKSIKLLLESLAYNGCDVYAIMGCTSDSKNGFKINQEIWLSQSKTATKEQKAKEFTANKVNYFLVATEHWSRQYLAADEQEAIYRLSTNIIGEEGNRYTRRILIGWGNLLLEESIFRAARGNDFETIFYLANPTYKGKIVETLKLSTKIITDSLATKALYSEENLPEIHVLPKCVEKPNVVRTASQLWNDQTIIFVNPKLQKGLEALLIIAEELYKIRPKLIIRIVDSTNRLESELRLINKTTDHLPRNICLAGSYPNTDKLLEDVSIVLLLSLWHESGSRLIHESHLRGIPVIAFHTGGTSELIGKKSLDTFQKPATTRIDGHLRIQAWDPVPILERINELMSSIKKYEEHSEFLRLRSQELIANNAQAAKVIIDII